MIKIITDSASDILQEQAKKLGISVLPMKIIFSDGEYLDGITLLHQQFYEKIRDLNEIPKTSQINIYDFSQEFEKYKDDEVIVITMSSKLSGTYQSALLASEEFENIHVIDSGNVTVGEQILVLLAIDCINKGMDVNSIVKLLNEEKQKICAIGILDTLDFLKKGGRISSAQAIVGSLLSIKPVCGIKDGAVIIHGKARGYKNAYNIVNNVINSEGGINLNRPFLMSYSGFNVELANKFITNNKELFLDKLDDINIKTIGATIGTHIGPDTVILAFFRN